MPNPRSIAPMLTMMFAVPEEPISKARSLMVA
jgi:hypothetical protein